jgi:hypothetical protein
MSRAPADRRTKVVTAVGILAVIVAGAFAVSANLGILSASSEPKVGALAAAGDLLPTTDATRSPASSTPPRSAPTETQRYLVDAAGAIAIHDDPITIDHVELNPGWSWRRDASDGHDVVVELTDGTRTLRFTATRAGDGTVAATLDEMSRGTAPATVTTPIPPHEDENEAHERAQHEGRDDDD